DLPGRAADARDAANDRSERAAARPQRGDGAADGARAAVRRLDESAAGSTAGADAGGRGAGGDPAVGAVPGDTQHGEGEKGRGATAARGRDGGRAGGGA